MEVSLMDNQVIDMNCPAHDFSLQADVTVDGIIWDVYYCRRCLMHVKKERPCPTQMDEIVVEEERC